MKTYIGIDVGKHQLDVSHGSKHFNVENTKVGIKKLIVYLDKHKQPQSESSDIIVVFEATGGYERDLKINLLEKKYDYHMAHPNKVRAFAKAKGLLAKTDKIDAHLIQSYAQAMSLTPDAPEINHTIKELLKRRDQCIAMRIQERNRTDKGYSAFVKSSMEEHCKWLNKEIVAIEKQLKLAIVEANMQRDIELLTSIPGIAELTASYILAYMPEIKTSSQGQLAALAGIAPMNRDSGSFRGRRFIQGGRAPLRKALYMAAVPSVRFNPELNRFYHHLRSKGKSAKVALVAVMRKLLLLAASILKRETLWERRVPNIQITA